MQKSNWLPTICQRSENGPYMKESEYDLTLARTVARLVKDYEITYNPQVLVPNDDDLADRVYKASVDLFTEMGVYNQTTQRRILFTREEVEEAVAAAPHEVVLGAGKDAVGKLKVHCGDLVKTAAKTAGGGGGGSPVRAQAGGKNPAKIDAALDAAAALLNEKAGAS